MKLIGFSLNKICAEIFSNKFNELKIENNIKIEDIQSTNTDIFKKDEEVLNVQFNYSLNYNPNVAKLSFIGTVLLLVGQKESKAILKQWEEKKISDNLKISIFNIILKKTNIKALILEEELNLPLHISVPFLKAKKKE